MSCWVSFSINAAVKGEIHIAHIYIQVIMSHTGHIRSLRLLRGVYDEITQGGGGITEIISLQETSFLKYIMISLLV